MKKKTRKHSTYPKCVDATHILCFYISILFLKRSGWLWIKISSVFAPFVWVFFSYFFLFHIVLPNAIRSKNVHCVGFHFSLLSTPYYQMCEVCILKHITRKKNDGKKSNLIFLRFRIYEHIYFWNFCCRYVWITLLACILHPFHTVFVFIFYSVCLVKFWCFFAIIV